MLEIKDAKAYYSRDEIKKALVAHANGREVAIRFDSYFGKRPDILQYPNDISETAKKGATSYHVSEERWTNPLELSTSMRKRDLDELRSGWDFILDIDCPIWEYSKLITFLLVKALKKHNVNCISIKFSGNKGFHIGVPFEAFPETFANQKMEALFPEAPKRIVALWPQ